MEGITEDGGGRRWSRWRIAAWSAAALILLLPLVAMQFTDEVNWDVADFALAGILLVGVGISYELAARKTGDTAYKFAVGLALAAAFILIWVNGAVGIIGSENNDANLLFFGVLAVAAVGSLIARFRAGGMAIALYATALAQVILAAFAITMSLGTSGPTWPRDILMLTAVFSAIWLASGWLFGRAADTERRLFFD